MSSELHILMLEDDPLDAELTIAALEQAGYPSQCDCVDTGAAFAQRLDTQVYDLVLSDYHLPTFDGLSALHLLRARDPDLPFILISGMLGEETAIESLKSGATDYVMKSHLARLGLVVGRALRERDEQRQRREAEMALRRAEARYRDLFENAKDMIYTRDLSGRFTSANSMCERMTGYTQAELLTMNINQLVAPEYKQPARLAYLMEREIVGAIIPEEMEFIRKDGTRLWVELNVRLIYEDGQPTGAQSIVRDVSERRRAEEERYQLESQLFQAQKMESIGTLAGGVAHDFNNILTVILGNVQLTLEGAAADSPDYSLLREIEKAAARATALTRQLLMFSRRQPLERHTIELNSTINDLSHMLRRIIGEDIEILIRPEVSAALIFADVSQVQQVLMNLVVNARDAMPHGGQLSIITRELIVDDAESQACPGLATGRYIELIVRDTGVGMDDETQQRIFEPFFTTKDQGKGTGLGLAVVYGIIKQHEGLIRVESRLHEGTTFTILLPSPQLETVRHTLDPLPAVRGGSETILVAEDESALRYLASMVLERLGYTVLLARDGFDAVSMFHDHAAKIDLAVLDLVMPRLGGRDALQRMRATRPDLRALFVTGYDDAASRASSGYTPIPGTVLLQKPYRIDTLGVYVRELLDSGTF